jgi:hypothetical protein
MLLAAMQASGFFTVLLVGCEVCTHSTANDPEDLCVACKLGLVPPDISGYCNSGNCQPCKREPACCFVLSTLVPHCTLRQQIQGVDAACWQGQQVYSVTLSVAWCHLGTQCHHDDSSNALPHGEMQAQQQQPVDAVWQLPAWTRV